MLLLLLLLLFTLLLFPLLLLFPPLPFTVTLQVRTLPFTTAVMDRPTAAVLKRAADALFPGLLKIAYAVSEPQRGDIVVIKVSEEKNLVKRVIATGGQKVEIIQSRVYIDGEELDEEYISDDLVYSDYGPIVVPEGYIFAMGDNRPSSIDSRAMGCFPAEDVLGRVCIRFVPFTVFRRIP